VYLTLREAIKKLGYTEVQLMQCIAVGHICPVTVTAEGEFPVENAREKADWMTERHYILKEMPEGSEDKFYPCSREEYNKNTEVQEIVEFYREELPDCDLATIGLTVKPKVYVDDQRIPIIIIAIRKEGVDRLKVPARGGTITRIRKWCEDNYPKIFPKVGREKTSKSVFNKVWRSGKGKHWNTVPKERVKQHY